MADRYYQAHVLVHRRYGQPCVCAAGFRVVGILLQRRHRLLTIRGCEHDNSKREDGPAARDVRLDVTDAFLQSQSRRQIR